MHIFRVWYSKNCKYYKVQNISYFCNEGEEASFISEVATSCTIEFQLLIF